MKKSKTMERKRPQHGWCVTVDLSAYAGHTEDTLILTAPHRFQRDVALRCSPEITAAMEIAGGPGRAFVQRPRGVPGLCATVALAASSMAWLSSWMAYRNGMIRPPLSPGRGRNE